MNQYEEIKITELSINYDVLLEYQGEQEYIIIPEGVRVLSSIEWLRNIIFPWRSEQSIYYDIFFN